MDLSQAPPFVAVKIALLSDACATATIRADELTAQISDLRDRWNGRTTRQGDHPKKLRIELEQRLEEQKALQRQRPIETDILGRCRAWLAGLPSTTVFEQVIPDVKDGLSLVAVRARIKQLKSAAEALRDVPVPPSDIREKVRSYVQDMTRPAIGGIGTGEVLSVQWPTGPHALMAFIQPEALVERLMAQIDRIANTRVPWPSESSRLPSLKIRSTDSSAPRRPSSSPPVRHANRDACLGSCWVLRP
jgi:hypothetical protein